MMGKLILDLISFTPSYPRLTVYFTFFSPAASWSLWLASVTTTNFEFVIFITSNSIHKGQRWPSGPDAGCGCLPEVPVAGVFTLGLTLKVRC